MLNKARSSESVLYFGERFVPQYVATGRSSGEGDSGSKKEH